MIVTGRSIASKYTRDAFARVWGFFVTTSLSVFAILITTVGLLSNVSTSVGDIVIRNTTDTLLRDLSFGISGIMQYGVDELSALVIMAFLMSAMLTTMRYPFRIAGFIIVIVYDISSIISRMLTALREQ